MDNGGGRSVGSKEEKMIRVSARLVVLRVYYAVVALSLIWRGDAEGVFPAAASRRLILRPHFRCCQIVFRDFEGCLQACVSFLLHIERSRCFVESVKDIRFMSQITKTDLPTPL